MLVETPRRQHDPDGELQALIEEARRRAWRRRILLALVALGALVAILMVLWGGGNDRDPGGANLEGSSPEPSALTNDSLIAGLRPCPTNTHGRITAGGWGGSVSNISCREAGQLIFHNFLREREPSGFNPKEIAAQPPGVMRSSGFRCDYAPLQSGFGWRLTCIRDDQGIRFNITP
jgi:hypothetical protein